MLDNMLTITNKYPYTKDTIRKINAVTQWLEEKDFFIIEIDFTTSKKFYGDFSGLLNSLNVPLVLHPYIMSINNIDSSDMHMTDIKELKLVNEDKIKSILDYTLG